MFHDTEKEFSRIKYITEKTIYSSLQASLTRVRVVVDHAHHTAHPITKIGKGKDPVIIVLISVFGLPRLYSLLKSILNNRFAALFFTHSRLMRCPSSAVLVPLAALLLTSFLNRC